jgi:hypothetical protein
MQEVSPPGVAAQAMVEALPSLTRRHLSDIAINVFEPQG